MFALKSTLSCAIVGSFGGRNARRSAGGNLLGRRTKKEIELLLCREFFKLLGYRVAQMRGGERPDIVVVAYAPGSSKPLRTGIELTDYAVDAPIGPGGSPGMKLDAWWEAVRTSICRRVAQIPDIQRIGGSVTLRPRVRPPLRAARPFAAELVRLARQTPVKDFVCISGRSLQTDYQLLRNCVQYVDLRVVPWCSRYNWHCPNASTSNVGVRLDILADIIRTKSAKAQAYDRTNADGLWLLVSASAKTAVNSAGPPDLVDWTDSRLIAACCQGVFDRIFFCDHRRGWCKPIWPDGPLIQQSRALHRDRNEG